MWNVIIEEYKKRIIVNIIQIVVFFNVMIGVIYYTDDFFIENTNNRNFFVSLPEGLGYLSEYIGEEAFETVISETSYEFEQHIGYQYHYIDKSGESVTRYIYLNEYMSKLRYPMKKGNWIENANEVILGGELSNKYNIGDHYYIEGKCIGKIVGFLGEEYHYMFLNVSGEDLQYIDIFTKTDDNIVITNNDVIMDAYDMDISNRAIVADGKGIELLNEKGCLFEYKITLDNIDITNENYIDFLMTGMLWGAIIISVVYLAYIGVYKNEIKLKVLWEQGFSKKQLSLYMVFPAIANGLVAIIFVILYSCMVFKSDAVSKYVYSTLIIALFVVYICIYFWVLEIIKRKVR